MNHQRFRSGARRLVTATALALAGTVLTAGPAAGDTVTCTVTGLAVSTLAQQPILADAADTNLIDADNGDLSLGADTSCTGRWAFGAVVAQPSGFGTTVSHSTLFCGTGTWSGVMPIPEATAPIPFVITFAGGNGPITIAGDGWRGSGIAHITPTAPGNCMTVPVEQWEVALQFVADR